MNADDRLLLEFHKLAPYIRCLSSFAHFDGTCSICHRHMHEQLHRHLRYERAR